MVSVGRPNPYRSIAPSFRQKVTTALSKKKSLTLVAMDLFAELKYESGNPIFAANNLLHDMGYSIVCSSQDEAAEHIRQLFLVSHAEFTRMLEGAVSPHILTELRLTDTGIINAPIDSEWPYTKNLYYQEVEHLSKCIWHFGANYYADREERAQFRGTDDVGEPDDVLTYLSRVR